MVRIVAGASIANAIVAKAIFRNATFSSALFSSAIARLLLFSVLLPLATAVSAHHSTAIYDSDNPVELAGTVVEWKFTNPHCIIVLDVASADGSTQRWNVEGGNTSGLFRNGWTPETLQPGDAIIVTVRPLRSGAFGGNYSNPRRSDGEPVVAAPAAR